MVEFVAFEIETDFDEYGYSYSINWQGRCVAVSSCSYRERYLSREAAQDRIADVLSYIFTLEENA